MITRELWSGLRRAMWRVTVHAAAVLAEDQPADDDAQVATLQTGPPKQWLERVRSAAPQLLTENVAAAAPSSDAQSDDARRSRDANAGRDAAAKRVAQKIRGSVGVPRQRTIRLFGPRKPAAAEPIDSVAAENRTGIPTSRNSSIGVDSTSARATRAPSDSQGEVAAQSSRQRRGEAAVLRHVFSRPPNAVATNTAGQPTGATDSDAMPNSREPRGEKANATRRAFKVALSERDDTASSQDSRSAVNGSSAPPSRLHGSAKSILQPIVVAWPVLDTANVQTDSPAERDRHVDDRWPDLPDFPPFMAPREGGDPAHDPDHAHRLHDEQQGIAWSE